MAKKHEEEQKTTLDKLNSNLGSASEKIANNKKIIYWVVGLIAAAAAFYIGYQFIYLNPRTNQAWEEEGASEIATLNKQLEMMNGTNQPADIDSAINTVRATEYKKVADKYGSMEAGQLAALQTAEAYYDLKKYKEALDYLNKVSIDEPVLDANAKVLAGDCYVNLKQYDNAFKAYEEAIKRADKNPEIVPRVLVKEANIYDDQKKYDKALECYEQIKNDYPEFMFGDGSPIDAYIAREKSRLGK